MKRFRNSFRDMNLKPSTYFILVAVSVVVFGVLVPTIFVIFFSDYLSGMLGASFYAIPIFLVFVVVMLPFLASSKRKIKIERNMPMFITEMAALSTSEMSFGKIFHILSDRDLHGPLSEEAKKVYRLVNHYYTPAGDSCRFISERTPSPMERDFFNRLAHAVELGENFQRFMKNEHDVMMDEYILKCEATIKDLDFLKELYTGIVTSLIFICVFVSIVPLLGVESINVILFGTVLAFIAMEALFVYFVIVKVPKDEIWYSWRLKWKNGYITETDRILLLSVLVSGLGVILLFIILLPFDLPPSLFASTIFMPLVVPAILVVREERRIEKRDNIFGAFARSLGRSSSVSGITMSEAIKKLSMHKFGPMTKMVRNLSRRLSMHISAVDSWKHFSSETGSNLISRFGDIYTGCVLNGANPNDTSLFISNNMFKILAIRKKKHVLSASFMGILYGVMIALSFTLWITLGITNYMSEIVGDLVVNSSEVISGGFLDVIFNAQFTLEPLELMAFSVILIHAFFSSLMLPLLRGGHITTAAVHFIVLLWVGSLAQFCVGLVLSGLLG